MGANLKRKARYMTLSVAEMFAYCILRAGALAAWASTAWSPWKGRLGAMNTLNTVSIEYLVHILQTFANVRIS